MKVQTKPRTIGILYITTVLSFVVSNLSFNEKLIDSNNISLTLDFVLRNPFAYRTSVAIDFLAMVAVMALAIGLFLLLKPFNSAMAYLALGWRIGEVVLQSESKIIDFLLFNLGQITTGSPTIMDMSIFNLGRIIIAASDNLEWFSFIFFSLGSLFNNYLFYKIKLIPSSLSIFGLISTVMFTLRSIFALLIELPEIFNMAFMMPLTVFELSLGFYLTIFNQKVEKRILETQI